MSHAVPAPTTQQIRAAVALIHDGVHDPDADPVEVAIAHAVLARARHTTRPPVQTWLTAYLDHNTTAHGARAFRDAVNALARHFKLPPARRLPPPGEQGTLFD